jgi:hypothetical protein
MRVSVLALALLCLAPVTSHAHRTAGSHVARRAMHQCRAAVRAGDGSDGSPQKPNFFGRLMQGLDDMVDDALDRKLGNGASFYGKRKSNFYGSRDGMKKSDPRKANPEEDYRGNKGGSYFVWDKDLDAPLTKKQARLKKAGKLTFDSEDDS